MSKEERERILRGVEELTDLAVLRKAKKPLSERSAVELRKSIVAEKNESQLRTISK